MKPKIKFICPVCRKELYLFPSIFKSKKTCSYSCRNKSEYHRECNSKSKKGISVPWNKGVKGYTTARKGMKHSLETKEKMKNSSWFKKDGWQEKYFKTKNSVPSKYEQTFAKILDKKDIVYQQQAIILNKYQVDFLIDEKLIIEIDGDWHYKKDKLIENDIKRDLFFYNNGYNVIHIRHKEVDCLC